MPSKDEETETETDDSEFDPETRVDLRDYPSTMLVLLGVAGSGLAWMLYNWLGRKKPTDEGSLNKATGEAASSGKENTPGNEAAKPASRPNAG
ncbi:hypothetical protein [Microvirga roseola]|uniref:hypothetical protein n=1 Tax=Microvirga roseola TaxID=2883126 RepID=UPI001E341132|nr:hypothetical protein [Microvirga roseola]